MQSTRDLGLYLVITIGNGANNGNYKPRLRDEFWEPVLARYANETHVMFEIQNEPVAGAPYCRRRLRRRERWTWRWPLTGLFAPTPRTRRS